MSIVPSQAIDAEQHLIGSVLAGYDRIDDLAELVQPSDFYAPAHEAIWEAILRVHSTGAQPDVVNVRLALGDASRVDPIRLLEMSQLPSALANAPAHALTIAEQAGRRALQSGLLRAQQVAATESLSLEEARESVLSTVTDAARGRQVSRARTLAQVLPEVIDIAEHGKGSALSTPWPDLDGFIGGISPGRLIVFGARPGGGKSIAGTQLALHVAERHGHAVLLCSLEMTEEETAQRILANAARVDLSRLQEGKLDADDWQRVAAKSDTLLSLPLTIEDSPNMTIEAIRRAARDIQRTRDDLALIVVDYLQLVTPGRGRREANRAEEVSDIARGLKLLARETGACVAAMAQVNRAGGQRDNGPTLTDIREGGAENDADQVVLLHLSTPEAGEVTMRVAKNRHGPMGEFPVQMAGHYARLVSLARTP